MSESALLHLTCETCGKSYDKHRSQRRGRDYCSAACYHAGRLKHRIGRTVLQVTCDHCGKQFERFKGNEREHNFCSRPCYWKSDYRAALVANGNAGRNPQAHVTEPCGNCGTPVTRYVSSRGKVLYCDADCHNTARRKSQKRQRTAGGYIRIFAGYGYPGVTKTGHIFEHRKVMQDLLGRPLLPEENVHHINGVRDDNRPGNLELWSTSQPQGQRVEDKIRWAREFLAVYDKE
nr:MAG TPA_asm: PROTEIN/DNA Complex catalytic motif, Helix-turn-helix DNA [Caudoviricetes sp.]